MPVTKPLSAEFLFQMQAQDYVVSHDQCLEGGLTRHVIAGRLARHGWQRLLPGVYLCHPGTPSRRQRMVAALLYAGPGSAIDADDACVFYGVQAVRADDHIIRVVVDAASDVRSRGFVVVRRTVAPIRTVDTDRLRYLEPAAAVVASARLRTSPRRVLAILSDAVQRGVIREQDLVRAHIQGPPRNARLCDAALEQVTGGVRSAWEGEFRWLAESSLLLPPLLYNRKIRLPTGDIFVPDALCVEAALVHETNGRRAHGRDDLFEDMQQRHELLTVSGLAALHSSPHRLRTAGRIVLARFEELYLQRRGMGLPPGVVLLPVDGDNAA